MTPQVTVMSGDAIERREAELRASLRMTLEEARARARSYELSIAQADVLREIDRLEFLAGR